MYGYDGDSKPIFVDEQLTKYTYTLFAQAKQLKKAGFQTAMFYIDKPTILKLNAFIPTRKSMKLKKTIMLSKNKAVNKQRQQTGTSDQRNKKREKMNKHDKRNQTQNRHQHTSETDDDEA